MKLKAKDLRLGNGLQKDMSVDDIVEIQVKIGDLLMIEIEEDMEDGTYFPIPLTIEELLKFDVKEIEHPRRGVAREFVANGVRLEVSNSGNIYYKNSKFVLEFVHQLQNLYHSLRGKELKRKA